MVDDTNSDKWVNAVVKASRDRGHSGLPRLADRFFWHREGVLRIGRVTVRINIGFQ